MICVEEFMSIKIIELKIHLLKDITDSTIDCD